MSREKCMIPKIDGKRIDFCHVETKEGLVFIKVLPGLIPVSRGLVLTNVELSVGPNNILKIVGYTVAFDDWRNSPKKNRRIKTSQEMDGLTNKYVRTDFYTETWGGIIIPGHRYVKPEVFLWKERNTLVLTATNWVLEEMYSGTIDFNKVDEKTKLELPKPHPESPKPKNEGITF